MCARCVVCIFSIHPLKDQSNDNHSFHCYIFFLINSVQMKEKSNPKTENENGICFEFQSAAAKPFHPVIRWLQVKVPIALRCKDEIRIKVVALFFCPNKKANGCNAMCFLCLFELKNSVHDFSVNFTQSKCLFFNRSNV